MEDVPDTGASLDPAKPEELNRNGRGLATGEAWILNRQYRVRFKLVSIMTCRSEGKWSGKRDGEEAGYRVVTI
jgi:hypothetical protein